MNQQNNWIRFSYKSAFIFFAATALLNMIFIPILRWAGLGDALSSFLVNTIGISTCFSFVYLKLNKAYKNRRQAIQVYLLILVLTAFVNYAFILR